MSNFGVHPTIFSPELEVREEEGCQWASIGDQTVLLLIQNQAESSMFCLVVSSGGRDEAYAKAESGLQLDPQDYGNRAFARRAPMYDRLADVPDNSLLARGLEELVFHLENKTGDPPRWWSAANVDDRPSIDPNQVIPLALAWKELDENVAQDIVVSTIAQSHSLYPSDAEPSEPASCPWPCLVAAAEINCAGADPDTDLIGELLPPLHGYLERAIRYFDPNENGMVTWKRATEAFIPDAHDADLASASLCAMLLEELEAYARLSTLAGQDPSVEAFTAERERFKQAMSTTFWDPERGIFSDCYIGGDPVSRLTVSGLMVLWNRSIDKVKRDAIMRWVHDPRFFEGPDGIPLWEKWENDPVPPPVPPLHQIFMLHALKNQNQRETALAVENRVVRSMLRHAKTTHQLLVDLHTGKSADPQANEPHWYDLPLITGCLIVSTAPNVYQPQANEISPFARSLENNRRVVVGSVLAAFAVLILVFSLVLNKIGSRQGRETNSSELLRHLVIQEKFDEALDLLEKWARKSPQGNFQFLRANILAGRGRHYEAEQIYRSLIESRVDEKKATLNLALCLFKQGNFDEAEFTYQSFLDQYEDAAPRMRLMAQIASEFLEQNKDSLSLDMMKNFDEGE